MPGIEVQFRHCHMHHIDWHVRGTALLNGSAGQSGAETDVRRFTGSDP